MAERLPPGSYDLDSIKIPNALESISIPPSSDTNGDDQPNPISPVDTPYALTNETPTPAETFTGFTEAKESIRISNGDGGYSDARSINGSVGAGTSQEGENNGFKPAIDRFHRSHGVDRRMGDLCYSTTNSRGYNNHTTRIVMPLDHLLSRLLGFTSSIRNRFIQFFDDLIYTDVNRYSQHFVSFQNPESFNGASSSSSSTSNNLGTVLDMHKLQTSSLQVHSSSYSGCEIIERNFYYGGIYFITKGLEVARYVVKSALLLTFAPYHISSQCVKHAQIHLKSILCRVQVTFHGSSNDIGWMQRDPNMDPVTDGSARFLELLYAIRNGEHKLPDSYVYLLIPGLFSNHGPLYFVSTKKFFSKMGLACHIAKIHSEASVEYNSWVLKQYIEELNWGSGKRVMLLGHSKGGVDAAAALSLYWCDLKDKVAGLALVQSPYGGTPIASDMMREGQIADNETRRIMKLIICKIIKGDIRSLEDLTYEKRKQFLRQHKLPKGFPLISFRSEASVGPGVISMMSHIAHVELAKLSLVGPIVKHQVPVVAPVSAAMAMAALHLQLRYGEKSDGLVTCRDAEVPGSVVIRPDQKLDHAWMVYSSWNKNQTGAGADACEMCEALLTMLVELGYENNSGN